MSITTRWAVPLILGFTMLASAAPAGGQTKDKIHHELSAGQIDTILTELNVKFKKSQPNNSDKDWDFEFQRNSFNIRLSLFKGKLVWISAFFPRTTPEKINEWNQKVKFSRAVLDSIGGSEVAVVEFQLDAGGGVTDNILKQFIKRFDGEVERFDKFLK